MTSEGLLKPWYREPYVWLLITFPLSAVIGGIITITLAIQSDDGLVVDDYYQQGLEINRTLKRDRAAEQYKIVVNLQYSKNDEKMRLVLVAASNFNYPQSIKISFLNASRDGFDVQYTMHQSAENTYLGENPKLIKGKWHVLIEADDWRVLEVIQVS